MLKSLITSGPYKPLEIRHEQHVSGRPLPLDSLDSLLGTCYSSQGLSASTRSHNPGPEVAAHRSARPCCRPPASRRPPCRQEAGTATWSCRGPPHPAGVSGQKKRSGLREETKFAAPYPEDLGCLPSNGCRQSTYRFCAVVGLSLGSAG